MTRKRNFKTTFYLTLRHLGMLCKVPRQTVRKIHVAKTIHPDGSETSYDAPLDVMPENPNPLQSAIAVFIAEKKLSRDNCKFDAGTQSCVCGNSLDSFLNKTCNNKK